MPVIMYATVSCDRCGALPAQAYVRVRCTGNVHMMRLEPPPGYDVDPDGAVLCKTCIIAYGRPADGKHCTCTNGCNSAECDRL